MLGMYIYVMFIQIYLGTLVSNISYNVIMCGYCLLDYVPRQQTIDAILIVSRLVVYGHIYNINS